MLTPERNKQPMTNEQLAIAYAAQKELERIIAANTDLPPGDYDVSGQSIALSIPSGTIVSRSPGENGDGMVEKIASTNVNGFAVIACMFHVFTRVLALFRQKDKAEKHAMRLVKRIVNKAVRSKVSTESAFKKMYPKMAEQIDAVRDNFRQTLPKRSEPTARRINREDKEAIATPIFPPKRKRLAA